MERDCMRCENTFEDNGEHDLCKACRHNPNRVILGHTPLTGHTSLIALATIVDSRRKQRESANANV